MDFWIPDEIFFTKNSRFAFTPHPCGDFFAFLGFKQKNRD